MACTTCGKKPKRNPPKVITLGNSFQNEDFIRVIYNGENGIVIGQATFINYGTKNTDDIFLVHINDYNHESNLNNELFSEVSE